MEFAVLFVSWGLFALAGNLLGLSDRVVLFGYAALGCLFFILALARFRRHPRKK